MGFFSLVVSAFETEFFISGLAPLADQLVTLYFVKENSDHMVMFGLKCCMMEWLKRSQPWYLNVDIVCMCVFTSVCARSLVCACVCLK